MSISTCAVGELRYVALDGSPSTDPTPAIQFLEDTAGRLSIEQIRDADFADLNASTISFGFTKSKYWLRFGVRNTTSERLTTVLKTTARFMRPLVIYQKRGSRFESVLYNDEQSPFEERPGASRHLGYQFSLGPSEMTEFYVYFGAGGAAVMGLTLDSIEEVVAEQTATSLKTAIFLAVIGTLILSNLFFFVAIRAMAFLTYIAQETMFVLYVTHMDGFTFQYLWPKLSLLNANATPVIGGLCLASALWFSITFLQSHRYTPRYYRVLMSLLLVLVVNAILSVFLSNRIFNQSGLILFWVLAANLVPHAIYVVMKGHLAARFYLAGWAILIGMIGWFTSSILLGYEIPYLP
ncbi:MAG: hypothetical protein HN816_00005, partial [Gammaproteobacteria bacterium]|nr:hypothetical protein [Gammaproteobacteria bacterium]